MGRTPNNPNRPADGGDSIGLSVLDFRVGGKLLCCMRAPDGQEGWNAVEYYEIVPYEKIVSLMYFSDPEGTRLTLRNWETNLRPSRVLMT